MFVFHCLQPVYGGVGEKKDAVFSRTVRVLIDGGRENGF